MIVRCINDTVTDQGPHGALTLDKNYKVIRNDGQIYYFITDNISDRYWYKSRFEVVTELDCECELCKGV